MLNERKMKQETTNFGFEWKAEQKLTQMTTTSENPVHPSDDSEGVQSAATAAGPTRTTIFPDVKQIALVAVIPAEEGGAGKHRIVLSGAVFQIQLLSLKGVRTLDGDRFLEVCTGFARQTFWNESVGKFCLGVMRHLIEDKKRSDLFGYDKTSVGVQKMRMSAVPLPSIVTLSLDESGSPLAHLDELVRKTGWYDVRFRLAALDVAFDGKVEPVFDCVGAFLTDRNITEQDVIEERRASTEVGESAPAANADAAASPVPSPANSDNDPMMDVLAVAGSACFIALLLGGFCWCINTGPKEGLLGDIYTYEFTSHEEMQQTWLAWHPNDLCAAMSSSVVLSTGGNSKSNTAPIHMASVRWINKTLNSPDSVTGIPGRLPTAFQVVHWHGMVWIKNAGIHVWEVQAEHPITLQLDGRIVSSTIPRMETSPIPPADLHLEPGWHSVQIWWMHPLEDVDRTPLLRVKWMPPTRTAAVPQFVPVNAWFHFSEDLNLASSRIESKSCSTLRMLKEREDLRASLAQLETRQTRALLELKEHVAAIAASRQASSQPSEEKSPQTVPLPSGLAGKPLRYEELLAAFLITVMVTFILALWRALLC